MKKQMKKLASLCLAVVLALCSVSTVYADETSEYGLVQAPITLFDNSILPWEEDRGPDGELWSYLVIVDGTDTVTMDDVGNMGLCFGATNKNFTFPELSLEQLRSFEGQFNDVLYSAKLMSIFDNNIFNATKSYSVFVTKLPDGLTASDMEEYAKYVIDANVPEKGEWYQDEHGWSIKYKDGSVLCNGWWQSPTSGLWYYMNDDGYMVTNTVIDGYTINADGVWVQ